MVHDGRDHWGTKTAEAIGRRRIMRKHNGILFLCGGLTALAILALPARPQATAPARVTVAVRVLDHGRFVGGLTSNDFELLDDGALQKLVQLCEVDKNAIVRQEVESLIAPITARRFYLLFQMYEWNPKMSEALRYFISNALLPGDSLDIQTPMRSYKLKPEALAAKPRDVIAREMDNIVKKDIGQGNLVYKGLVRDLRRFVQGMEGLNPAAGGDEQSDASASYFGLEYLLNQYRESLAKLETLQTVDQEKIIGFARALKNVDGRKLVFFIYQQEFRPEISPTMLNTLIDNNQDNQNILASLHELFQVYHRNISLDQKSIIEAYCDSGADLNFLFMARTPERFGGITMREQSEDVFKIFSGVAAATGGTSASTQNPLAEIRDALKASEDYYLLSYAPASATEKGAFRTIKVRIKDKDYTVLNRQGYIAD
jgi:hypothetical protein